MGLWFQFLSWNGKKIFQFHAVSFNSDCRKLSCRSFNLHPYLPCWSFFCYKIWNYTWVKRVFLKRVRSGGVNGIFITNAINSRFFFPSTFPKLFSFDSLGVNKINSTLLIMFDFGCWILITIFFCFSFKSWRFWYDVRSYGEVLIPFLDFFTQHFCDFFIHILKGVFNFYICYFKYRFKRMENIKVWTVMFIDLYIFV